MKLGKVITRLITIIVLILITLFIVWATLGNVLDKAFTQPSGKTHTEMMLWKSPGYAQESQLDFYKIQIYPSQKNIRVVYKITNTSNKATDIQDSLDIAVVAADANNIGDPGSTVWRWSQVYGQRKVNTISLAPGEFFNEEISIDRKQAIVNFQYYINAYYKGELVLQYKIIEGLYDK